MILLILTVGLFVCVIGSIVHCLSLRLYKPGITLIMIAECEGHIKFTSSLPTYKV